MPYLRRRFAGSVYLGIELEINQAIIVGAPCRWADLRLAVINSLRLALTSNEE